MKQIKTVEAIGHILCHDITQIVKDETKGVLFKKGHEVKAEDIEKLLQVGKEHLYVWSCDETKMHENDAAIILKEVCEGEGTFTQGEIKEGKIELFAAYDGLLSIDQEALNQLNQIEEIVVATRHNGMPVQKGEKLAGMRVVPLVISKDKMLGIQKQWREKPLICVKPYKAYQVSIVTTGSEVYSGRIQDTFGPVIREKIAEYGLEYKGQTIVPDQVERIEEAIQESIAQGANLIICTGGMSVDPDDLTPLAIQKVGAKRVTYGAPVLPGAMFLLAYKGDIPILGLPGCVMYQKRTIFDLIFPRVLTGEKVERETITRLGHGGLCLDCDVCHFPNCSFGKGV